MATPITNIPRGFLSLTGLRDMGGVPREVVPTITPGIDITQFLLLNRETIDVPVVFTGIQSIASITVPAGELWYVHATTVGTVVLPAGDSISVQVGYLVGSINVSIGDPVRATGGHRALAWATGFWLPAGDSISSRTLEFNVAAGTLNGVTAAIITRLRI